LTPEVDIVKSAFPSVQIVKAAPELYSFACRWYVSPSSWVTWLLAPPFWLPVQSLPVGAGEEVVGVGVGVGVGDVLGDGLDDDVDGLGSGLADEGEELGVGVADAPGRRLGDALADGDDEDGTGSGLGDDAGPDCATQCSRIELAGQPGARTDTSVSFPPDRQA
jgi:hypothetical protein